VVVKRPGFRGVSRTGFRGELAVPPVRLTACSRTEGCRGFEVGQAAAFSMGCEPAVCSSRARSAPSSPVCAARSQVPREQRHVLRKAAVAWMTQA
jgi:hypothetical protein